MTKYPIMENLTTRPDSIAVLDNSALSNFAKALKVFCGDDVSLFKDAEISDRNELVDAIF